jgi:hypothetical protein
MTLCLRTLSTLFLRTLGTLFLRTLGTLCPGDCFGSLTVEPLMYVFEKILNAFDGCAVLDVDVRVVFQT